MLPSGRGVVRDAIPELQQGGGKAENGKTILKPIPCNSCITPLTNSFRETCRDLRKRIELTRLQGERSVHRKRHHKRGWERRYRSSAFLIAIETRERERLFNKHF